ncbi:hypothetical protein PCE1_000142 [Barthelona sp. PCE]
MSAEPRSPERKDTVDAALDILKSESSPVRDLSIEYDQGYFVTSNEGRTDEKQMEDDFITDTTLVDEHLSRLQSKWLNEEHNDPEGGELSLIPMAVILDTTVSERSLTLTSTYDSTLRLYLHSTSDHLYVTPEVSIEPFGSARVSVVVDFATLEENESCVVVAATESGKVLGEADIYIECPTHKPTKVEIEQSEEPRNDAPTHTQDNEKPVLTLEKDDEIMDIINTELQDLDLLEELTVEVDKETVPELINTPTPDLIDLDAEEQPKEPTPEPIVETVNEIIQEPTPEPIVEIVTEPIEEATTESVKTPTPEPIREQTPEPIKTHDPEQIINLDSLDEIKTPTPELVEEIMPEPTIKTPIEEEPVSKPEPLPEMNMQLASLISFGKVHIGETACLILPLENPQDTSVAIGLSFEGDMKMKRSFSIGNDVLLVQGRELVEIPVKFSPEEIQAYNVTLIVSVRTAVGLQRLRYSVKGNGIESRDSIVDSVRDLPKSKAQFNITQQKYHLNTDPFTLDDEPLQKEETAKINLPKAVLVKQVVVGQQGELSFSLTNPHSKRAHLCFVIEEDRKRSFALERHDIIVQPQATESINIRFSPVSSNEEDCRCVLVDTISKQRISVIGNGVIPSFTTECDRVKKVMLLNSYDDTPSFGVDIDVDNEEVSVTVFFEIDKIENCSAEFALFVDEEIIEPRNIGRNDVIHAVLRKENASSVVLCFPHTIQQPSEKAIFSGRIVVAGGIHSTLESAFSLGGRIAPVANIVQLIPIEIEIGMPSISAKYVDDAIVVTNNCPIPLSITIDNDEILLDDEIKYPVEQSDKDTTQIIKYGDRSHQVVIPKKKLHKLPLVCSVRIVDCGVVALGKDKAITFKFKNKLDTPITNVHFSCFDDFTVDPTVLNFDPGQAHKITITFCPAQVARYRSMLSVTCEGYRTLMLPVLGIGGVSHVQFIDGSGEEVFLNGSVYVTDEMSAHNVGNRDATVIVNQEMIPVPANSVVPIGELLQVNEQNSVSSCESVLGDLLFIAQKEGSISEVEKSLEHVIIGEGTSPRFMRDSLRQLDFFYVRKWVTEHTQMHVFDYVPFTEHDEDHAEFEDFSESETESIAESTDSLSVVSIQDLSTESSSEEEEFVEEDQVSEELTKHKVKPKLADNTARQAKLVQRLNNLRKQREIRKKEKEMEKLEEENVEESPSFKLDIRDLVSSQQEDSFEELRVEELVTPRVEMVKNTMDDIVHSRVVRKFLRESKFKNPSKSFTLGVSRIIWSDTTQEQRISINNNLRRSMPIIFRCPPNCPTVFEFKPSKFTLRSSSSSRFCVRILHAALNSTFSEFISSGKTSHAFGSNMHIRLVKSFIVLLTNIEIRAGGEFSRIPVVIVKSSTESPRNRYIVSAAGIHEKIKVASTPNTSPYSRSFGNPFKKKVLSPIRRSSKRSRVKSSPIMKRGRLVVRTKVIPLQLAVPQFRDDTTTVSTTVYGSIVLENIGSGTAAIRHTSDMLVDCPNELSAKDSCLAYFNYPVTNVIGKHNKRVLFTSGKQKSDAYVKMMLKPTLVTETSPFPELNKITTNGFEVDPLVLFSNKCRIVHCCIINRTSKTRKLHFPRSNRYEFPTTDVVIAPESYIDVPIKLTSIPKVSSGNIMLWDVLFLHSDSGDTIPITCAYYGSSSAIKIHGLDKDREIILRPDHPVSLISVENTTNVPQSFQAIVGESDVISITPTRETIDANGVCQLSVFCAFNRFENHKRKSVRVRIIGKSFDEAFTITAVDI